MLIRVKNRSIDKLNFTFKAVLVNQLFGGPGFEFYGGKLKKMCYFPIVIKLKIKRYPIAKML